MIDRADNLVSLRDRRNKYGLACWPSVGVHRVPCTAVPRGSRHVRDMQPDLGTSHSRLRRSIGVRDFSVTNSVGLSSTTTEEERLLWPLPLGHRL
jgi:hypothetical protein